MAETEGARGDVWPVVEVASYVVYPTGYDDLVHTDKDAWCLTVTNGHRWGWRISRGIGMTGGPAMNRRGGWIYEDRGSGRNKPRRFDLDEALALAMEYVDRHTINGVNAAQASTDVAARIAHRTASSA